MNGGTSYSGGNLVIKYKKNTWLNHVEIIPSVSGTWQASQETWLSGAVESSFVIFKGPEVAGTMDGLILDFFLYAKDVSQLVQGHYIEIEYIAFVSDENLIGNN